MGKMINEEELMHYGVMGMRWGVRRASKRSGGSKKKKASRQSQQPQKKRRMSNKELQARVKRMQLEKQYRDLTNDLTPKTKSKMEKLVNTTVTISKLSSSAMTIYKALNTFAEISAKNKKG